MIKVLYYSLLSLLLVSCEPITGGQYQTVDIPTDTTNWKDQYVYGGVLQGGNQTQVNLVGTTWVLYKFVSNYSTSYPNDTIRFISSNRYILNQNAQRQYNLSQITGSTNKSLTLYYFYPFGGSSYSGQVSEFVVQDGEMNNIEFKNLQNSTAIIRAFFKKI